LRVLKKNLRGLTLKINFSEKPCVNRKERFMFFALPIVIIALLTMINITFFVYFRYINSSSHKRISALKQKISGYEKGINIKLSILKKIPYKKFKKEYYFYYSIARKKQLSWAKLFSEFEQILPDNVKLSMISPKVERSSVLLSISGEAKSKQAELKFIENLDKSKSFSSPFVEYESIDSGSQVLKFSISVRYRVGE